MRILGCLIIIGTILVGFLPCSDQEWHNGMRVIFPVFAGVEIGSGIVMILFGGML